MSSLSYKVINTKGKEVGKIDLDADVFGGEINATLVHTVVKWQLNKRRQGTHSTLNKTKMVVSGKKPWKQKGTGRARAGGADSPLWVGGAVAFGPQPRSYETRLNKTARRKALVSVLSEKVQGSQLVVLDSLTVESGKTKEFAGILKTIGAGASSSVVVLSAKEINVARTSRNIPKVVALPVEGVNVYDLLKHKFLICTRDGIEALQGRVKKG